MRSADDGEETSRQIPDTLTLTQNFEMTSSDIDSLADRVRSLLGKTAKYDPFETLTPPIKNDTIQNNTSSETSSKKDESSLGLLTSLLKSPNGNETNFTLPSFSPFNLGALPLEVNLPTIPEIDDNNNPNESNSSTDFSNSPISFSSNSIREQSDSTEKEAVADHLEKSYHRPTFVLPNRLSTIIEVSKSSDSLPIEATSTSRDSQSILREADEILQRIHKLQQGKQSRSASDRASISNLATSLPELSVETISHQHNSKEIISPKSSPIQAQAPVAQNEVEPTFLIDSSDPETEYLPPPAEPKRSMLNQTCNQTYNSHIYTQKTKDERAKSQQRSESITPPEPNLDQVSLPSTESHVSFVPNRTILEEEKNCLEEMAKGTDNLRRLQLELMQFEKEYVKQHERRKAKRKKLMALAAKNAAVSSTEGESTSATKSTSSHHHRQASTAKSGKDLQFVGEHKHQKGKAASGRQVEVKSHSADYANIGSKSKSSSASSSSTTRLVSSQARTGTYCQVTTQSRKETQQKQPSQQPSQQSTGQNRHSNSNPRKVRFDHQHIGESMEQLQRTVPCHSTERRLNKQSILTTTNTKNAPCPCCLRHAKMNSRIDGSELTEHRYHLDCLQLDRVRIDDDQSTRLDRRPHTAGEVYTPRSNTAISKSVQTSFLMEPVEEGRSKSVQIGPVSWRSDYDEPDYEYHQPGELPRTPPPSAKKGNCALIRKPLAYFVVLEGSEPRKRQPNNSGNTHRSNNRPMRTAMGEKQGSGHRMAATVAPAVIQPVAAHTLQEAFARNCNKFKVRSEMRARRIKDNVQLRTKTASTRQEEIIQIYMQEKRISSAKQDDDSRLQQTNGHNTYGKHNKGKQFRAGDQENQLPRPLPLTSRRVVPEKEMRGRTQKVYQKLPEYKAKLATAKREEEARRRRMMLNIFKQRLKENAIQGRLNWPITGQAIVA